MTSRKSIPSFFVVGLVFAGLLACGGGGDSSDDAAADGTGETGGDGDGDGDGEPCDWQNPEVLTVGKAIARATPSPSCADGIHYYRFVPPSDGAYEMIHSGQGSAAYCDPADQMGCICGLNINCCSECSLEFTQLGGGGPLVAGTAYPLTVNSYEAGSYTLEIAGPV